MYTEEEEEDYFLHGMYKQYRDFNRETNNRIYFINYLFIIINIFIITISFVFLPINLEKSIILLMFPFPLAGIVSCFYWRIELKNLLSLNDISFKLLMDMEKSLVPLNYKKESSFYEKLWDRLGDIEFRRSPLRSSPQSLLLIPVAFMFIHFFIFIGLFYLFL